MKGLKLIFIVPLLLISCAKEKEESSDSYKYVICGQVQQLSGQFVMNTGGTNVQLQTNSDGLQQKLYEFSSSGQNVCAYSDKELQQNSYTNSGSGSVFVVEKVKGSDSSNQNYSYKFCGTIFKNNGQTGGSSGYFLNYQNQNFSIYASSSQAQQYLNQISSSKSGCVHSNQQPQQGYEGYTVQAEYISQ